MSSINASRTRPASASTTVATPTPFQPGRAWRSGTRGRRGHAQMPRRPSAPRTTSEMRTRACDDDISTRARAKLRGAHMNTEDTLARLVNMCCSVCPTLELRLASAQTLSAGGRIRTRYRAGLPQDRLPGRNWLRSRPSCRVVAARPVRDPGHAKRFDSRTRRTGAPSGQNTGGTEGSCRRHQVGPGSRTTSRSARSHGVRRTRSSRCAAAPASRRSELREYHGAGGRCLQRRPGSVGPREAEKFKACARDATRRFTPAPTTEQPSQQYRDERPGDPQQRLWNRLMGSAPAASRCNAPPTISPLERIAN